MSTYMPLLCTHRKQVGFPYLFARLSVHHWNYCLQNKNLASFSFSYIARNHHPLIQKVLCTNYHLQFEILLILQECSMIYKMFILVLIIFTLTEFRWLSIPLFHLFLEFKIHFFTNIFYGLNWLSNNCFHSKKVPISKTVFLFATFPPCFWIRMNLMSFD